MTKDGSVSCPQARRVSSRRKNLNKKWTGKAWKLAREGFIKSHGGKCEWCGKSAGDKYVNKKGIERIRKLVVHHPYRNSYGEDVYLDFYLSECLLLCDQCHGAVHAKEGLELCTRSHDDNRNHYRFHDAEMCNDCYLKLHPEIPAKRKAEKQRKKEMQKAARKKQADDVKKWKAEHFTNVKSGVRV